jgi:hypothetical protein
MSVLNQSFLTHLMLLPQLCYKPGPAQASKSLLSHFPNIPCPFLPANLQTFGIRSLFNGAILPNRILESHA